MKKGLFLVLLLFFGLITVFATAPQPALAVGPVVNDQASCAEINGTWAAPTCTVDEFNIPYGEDLSIDFGVTLKITDSAYNSGDLINNGTIDNDWTFDNDGTINNNGTFSGGAVLNNFGTINNNNGGIIDNDGTIDNNGTINNAGTIDGEEGAIYNGVVIYNNFSGTIVTNETFVNYGDIYNDGTIDIFDLTFDNYGTIDNNGTINNYTRFIGAINNYTIIDNDGTINNDFIINNAGTIDNDGTIYNDDTINNNCGGQVLGNPVSNNPVIDACPPKITANVDGTMGNNRWYISDVVVSFSCTDEVGGSGIDIDNVAGATLTSDGANQSVTNTGECIDNAGNNASSVTVDDIDIDQTVPEVMVTGVGDGATYLIGAVPLAGCQTQDATSGVATQASLTLTGVGTITATCDGAVDNAGNEGAANVSYTVITPAEGTQNLVVQVNDLNLQQGIDNSLDSKLDAVLQALDDLNENNDVAATNALQAFINAVEAQRDKKISDTDADTLIANAQALIDAINAG